MPVGYRAKVYDLGIVAFALLLAGSAWVLILMRANPPATPTASPANPFPRLPIAFELNQGQAGLTGRFVSNAGGARLLFMPSEIAISVTAAETSANEDVSGRVTTPVLHGAMINMRFIDASPNQAIEGGAILPGKVSYLRGNDPDRWQTGLPTYSSIKYDSLYPGIDLSYSGSNEGLKGTYFVTPGADPTRIRWRYDGADKVSIDPGGNLQITVDSKIAMTEQAPIAWQDIDGQRQKVSVAYWLMGDGTVGFLSGNYDPSYTLIIDPIITYSTYLGGSMDDTIRSLTLDREGNIYVAGDTLSGDFPTRGPYQPSNAGSFDIFISKLDPTGSTLLYSTYLGGSNQDNARSIKVDTSGNVYVVGSTGSLDFPLASPIQSQYGGGDADAFLLKLAPGGDSLLYSSYLGGSVEDRGYGIAVHADGSASLTGVTWSSNFPLQKPLQTYCGIATYADGFVAKVAPSGSSLLYSTYLCGGDDDRGIAVAADPDGNTYITGHTNSDDFPTKNAYQPQYRGYQDTFVAKMNSTGSALVYSTYFGGTADEAGWAIALDKGDNAYISGFTRSPDLPLLNPVQAQAGGDDDAYLAKLDASGANLVYSTFLGGAEHDFGQGVVVDELGNASLVGRTSSLNFPTLNPIQPRLRGQSDAFAARFSPGGNPLLYSTYIGGSHLDDGWAVALGTQGSLYMAGWTFSTDFPLASPYQPSNRGTYDGFIVRLLDISPTPTATSMTTSTPVPPTLTPSPTACLQRFNDLPPEHTFYGYVICLACRGIVSGYADGTFRPGSEMTRGQLSKIVSNSAGLSEPVVGQRYEDVPPAQTFYKWIERLTTRSYMGGYPCGQQITEPCMPGNRPYFRPHANATRGQVSKIVSNAAGFVEQVQGQFYSDVPSGAPFYEWIMRLTGRNVMSGYPCGGVNPQTGQSEPCDDRARPYFRWANHVTRGQASKIVANSFFPQCESR